MSVRVAVIFYSVTGNVRRLAEAVARGAESADASVRLRRVPELVAEPAIGGLARYAGVLAGLREAIR